MQNDDTLFRTSDTDLAAFLIAEGAGQLHCGDDIPLRTVTDGTRRRVEFALEVTDYTAIPRYGKPDTVVRVQKFRGARRTLLRLVRMQLGSERFLGISDETLEIQNGE